MKYLKFGVYLLLIFIVLFPFLVLPRIIKIQKFECYSQYGICQEEMLALLNAAYGKSLRDAKVTLGKQFKGNELVRQYSFSFKLPVTLRIDLILNKAKFALYQKETAMVILVDKDGKVLQREDKTNLPKVVTSETLPNVGDRISESQLFALNLIYSLNFLYQVNFGEITPDGLIVKLPNNFTVIFPLSGDRDILLGSLTLVLSRLNQADLQSKIGNSKVIDLRFKNPIIR